MTFKHTAADGTSVVVADLTEVEAYITQWMTTGATLKPVFVSSDESVTWRSDAVTKVPAVYRPGDPITSLLTPGR